ncbi:hypothetical protein I4J34_11730 [Corynebacterium diphtheriae bv. mitis]|nr:hypothetical protein [Corynebacterium diphtheriae bv. mitis]
MHKLIDAFRLPNPHTRTIAPHMNSIISTIPSLPSVDSEQLHARDLGGGRATPDHPRKDGTSHQIQSNGRFGSDLV